MRLTRRRFLGVAATTLWASGAGPSLGARYVDQTGLKNQSFIWQPHFAPSGPVTIIVSLAEQILHVFRGDRLLGIARCQPTRAPRKIPAGAFRIDSVSSRHHAEVQWRGTSIHTFNASNADPAFLSGALSCTQISPLFAKLLKPVIRSGTLVIMAPQRTSLIPVRSFWPTASKSNTHDMSQGQNFDSGAFIFTRGTFVHGDTASPERQPLSIVVSSQDRRARIVSSQQPVQVVDVEIAQPHKLLGSHAYCLTAPKMGRSPGTWIATGVSAKGDAPHIRNEHAKTSLDRIAFVDPEVAADLNNALSPGASVVLTDAPLDDRDNATFIRPVLLTTDRQAPSVAKRVPEKPATTAKPEPDKPKARPGKKPRNKIAQNSNKLGAKNKTPARKYKKALKKKKLIKRPSFSNEPLIGPKNFQDP